jgi:hypothetical protein
MSDNNTKSAETSEEIGSSAPRLPTHDPILVAPLHCEAAQRRENYYISKLTLPPQQQEFINEYGVSLHLGQAPELKNALDATYGAESERSLPTFLKKWMNTSFCSWLYKSDEHKRSKKLQAEMWDLLNTESNTLGCALLTSIFPAFWDSLNMASGEEIPEVQAVATFMGLWRSLKRSKIYASIQESDKSPVVIYILKRPRTPESDVQP